MSVRRSACGDSKPIHASRRSAGHQAGSKRARNEQPTQRGRQRLPALLLCYVLYGVKYIGLVSLGAASQPISKSYIAPLFFKMACKQNLDLRCVLISDPSTLGAGAKTSLHTPKAVAYHEQPHYCRCHDRAQPGAYGIQNKEVCATLYLQALAHSALTSTKSFI